MLIITRDPSLNIYLKEDDPRASMDFLILQRKLRVEFQIYISLPSQIFVSMYLGFSFVFFAKIDLCYFFSLDDLATISATPDAVTKRNQWRSRSLRLGTISDPDDTFEDNDMCQSSISRVRIKCICLIYLIFLPSVVQKAILKLKEREFFFNFYMCENRKLKEIK